jgi:hypothetical protein
MKKIWLVLLISYLFLIFIFTLVGCGAIPEFTARAKLNTCDTVDSGITKTVYPYLEVTFDGENVRVASSDICFSFYLFNAFGDTLYSRNFEIVNKDSTKLFDSFIINNLTER